MFNIMLTLGILIGLFLAYLFYRAGGNIKLVPGEAMKVFTKVKSIFGGFFSSTTLPEKKEDQK